MNARRKNHLLLKQKKLARQYAEVELEPEAYENFQSILDGIDDTMEEIRRLLEGWWD